MLLRMLLLLLRHSCGGLHTIHWDSADMGTCLIGGSAWLIQSILHQQYWLAVLHPTTIWLKGVHRGRDHSCSSSHCNPVNVIIIPAVHQMHYICKMEAAFETVTSSEAGARQVVHERGRDTRAESPLAAAAAVG